MKFKVGDKVKAISESGGWGQVKKGDEGVITSISQYGGTYVNFSNQSSWYCKEKDLELIEDNIDYTIKGTKLPPIPEDMEYRCTNWSNTELNYKFRIYHKNDELVSYGSKEHNGETYILAEDEDYTGSLYFMFKLKDLQKLTNNNMEKKIIGYKLIKPEYAEAAVKITGFSNDLNKEGYFSDWMKSSPDGNFVNNLRDAGVLDLWFEPIYKEYETTITLSNGYEITLEKGKDHFIVGGQTIKMSFVKQLLERLGGKLHDWNIELVDLTINIGCWKNITKEDIELIIKTHKNL